MGVGSVVGQSVRIEGLVKDSLLKMPLPNVSITVTGGSGTRTDSSGRFVLLLNKPANEIKFQATGFLPVIIKLHHETTQVITVELIRQYTQISEVVVNSRKQHYTNKDNPAVELIRKVIAHKKENDIGAYPTATYRQYEKLCMYLDKFPQWLENTKFLKKYKFVFDNKDTTKVPGKKLTPIYIEETVSRNYFRRDPEKNNRLIEAQKKVDYGEFIDTHGVSEILNRLYENINIYDNSVVAFTRQFISPIADAGPSYYKYFIQDTVVEEGVTLVRLYLTPRNTAELLFTGTLYVTLDGHYSVRKLNLRTNKHNNLGLVRSFTLNQSFMKDSSSHRYYLSYSDMITDFGFTPGGSGMLGERTVEISNFHSGQPIADSLFRHDYTQDYKPLPAGSDSFFAASHEQPLSPVETNTYHNIDSMRNMQSYKTTMDIINLGMTGYKKFGPIAIGPIGNFLSYNPIEGAKPRIGGRTTTEFSTRYYLDGYIAYGLKDQAWKYFGSLTYSLNNKTIYRYPKHYLSFSYRHDTNIPGYDDEYVETNILLSVKKGANEKYLDNHIFRVDYLQEFGNHVSYALGLKYKKQSPLGNLAFVKESQIHDDSINTLTTGEVSAQLRWAPHEQFYQTDNNRSTIKNRYPVFTLTYVQGVKGLMGGQYNYSSWNASVKKRFYMVPLGYSDVSFNAGYLSGKVPWPLLIIHAGNQGYGYSNNGYNMMNYLEFVSDHYASLSINHYFKGFFFDRIPLLKKLKWREVAGAKILWGGVRNENRPEPGKGLFAFPTTNGVPTTFWLGQQPYVEVSAGISHIFKFLRIDLVRRLTYLNNPDVSKLDVRFEIKFEL